MSDHKGISVSKKKGYQVPDAYLQAFRAASPTCFGVVSTGKKNGALEITPLNAGVEMSDLKKIMKAFENFPLVMFGGSFPADYLADSIQPFGLIGGRNAQLAVTLVGDFGKYRTSDSKHSPEWWCAHNTILPMVQQIWRLAKEDISVLHSEIKEMGKQWGGLIGPQGGMITFILNTPEVPTILNFRKSQPTYKEFTWGDTSDVLDYVSGIETEEAHHKDIKELGTGKDKPVSETKKPKAKLKITVTSDPVADEEADKEADKKDDKADKPIIKPGVKELVSKNGGILRRTVVDGKEVWLWFPPIWMTKRRLLRKSYKEVCGKDVSNREIDMRIGVIPKDPEMILEIAKSGMVSATETAAIQTVEKPKPKEIEPTATEVVTAKNKVTGQDVVATSSATYPPDTGSPIYSATLSNKAKYDQKKYLKTLDNSGKAILPPTDFQDLEQTARSLMKEIDYDGLEQTFGWRPEHIQGMIQASVNTQYEFPIKFIQCLIGMIMNLEKQIDGLTDPDVTNIKVAETADKEVQVVFKSKKKAAA